MAQGDYIDLHKKRHGERMDAAERRRKKTARSVHAQGAIAQNTRGIKAKLLHQRRVKIASQKDAVHVVERDEDEELPAYLLDREETTRSKVLSNTVKQMRKEKAGRWNMPIQSVRPIADQEMFRVLRSGKRRKSMWKRVVTKPTFVGPDFTRKPPKFE
ncbi:MAG: putative Ribosome biogenesis protein NSA2, partial [Streblomastix strix]